MVEKFWVDSVEQMSAAMTKFYLSDGRVVHRFTQPDTGEPHNHPFIPRADGRPAIIDYIRVAGDSYSVQANTIHLLTEILSDECWTVVTPGEWVQKSGFYKWDEDGCWYKDWDGEFTLITPKT